MKSFRDLIKLIYAKHLTCGEKSTCVSNPFLVQESEDKSALFQLPEGKKMQMKLFIAYMFSICETWCRKPAMLLLHGSPWRHNIIFSSMKLWQVYRQEMDISVRGHMTTMLNRNITPQINCKCLSYSLSYYALHISHTSVHHAVISVNISDPSRQCLLLKMNE